VAEEVVAGDAEGVDKVEELGGEEGGFLKGGVAFAEGKRVERPLPTWSYMRIGML